jgi:DNA topoisomerase-3
VQTPTLALVVARDREIETFKPTPYHILSAQIGHVNGGFLARWLAAPMQPGLDGRGRLIDAPIAHAIVARVQGQTGRVTQTAEEPKSLPSPLPYSLTDITARASAEYGYSADDVLAACQALYETHKLTSYPRTDARHLPEIQHADAAAVLAALRSNLPALGGLIELTVASRKSRAWDDAKVTAHHGIVPTMHRGDLTRLSVLERHLYEMIARSYIAQFLSSHDYVATTIDVIINRYGGHGGNEPRA